MASEQPKGLSSAFSSSPSSHLPPCSSFSLTSHSNCSPGSHYCSISLFIFPFESLPPAKTVLFLAPSLGVSDLQGPWSLQGPNSSPRGAIGKGAREMLSNLHQAPWTWLGQEWTGGWGSCPSSQWGSAGLSAWGQLCLWNMFLHVGV